MQMPLSREQVDSIWKTLSPEQQKRMDNFTNRRKRDKWFEALALKKGIVLAEEMSDKKRETIDDWELVEILDDGEGNRPYRCECGKALRY